MLSIKRVVCEVEERLVLVSKKVPELRQAMLSLQHTLVMGLSSFPSSDSQPWEACSEN